MAPFHTALVELNSEGQNKGIEACSVQIKSNLSSAVQGVLPVMSLTDAVSSTLKEEGWEVSSTHVAETYIEFLEDLLSDIYLFSETPDIMTVILDTLNYESDYLTTRLDILCLIWRIVLFFSKISGECMSINRHIIWEFEIHKLLFSQTYLNL